MSENNKKVTCLATCPGGCNVSIMAYKAATILEKEGYGKFVKIAGGKAREKDTVRLKDADENAEQWVLIEGCSKGCGLDALNIAAIKPNKHCIITDLGIKRENSLDFTKMELETVVRAVKDIRGECNE